MKEKGTSGMKNGLGLFHAVTGDGKGKTTSALGLAMRAVGQGFRVIMIQFLKGEVDYGEHKAAPLLGGNFKIVRMGKGCLIRRGRLSDAELREHREAAKKALAFSRETLASGGYDIVILDEIHCALDLALLDLDEVLELIDGRPEGVELVFTGRYAPDEVLARADLVSEIQARKHPYEQGIKARRGIEF